MLLKLFQVWSVGAARTFLFPFAFYSLTLTCSSGFSWDVTREKIPGNRPYSPALISSIAVIYVYYGICTLYTYLSLPLDKKLEGRNYTLFILEHM